MIRSLIKKIAMMIIIAGCPVVMFLSYSHGASVSDSYPGHPNTWNELTSNSIIKIDLDAPVAMIGGQPDMIYHVKAVTFNGFDMILTDVACDVEVSGDGKTIRLYPQNNMDKNSLFAYRIESVNFSGGGSSQTDSRFYTTGNNPVPLLNTFLNEGEMCEDLSNKYGLTSLEFGNFCARCHVDYKPVDGKGGMIDCIITP